MPIEVEVRDGRPGRRSQGRRVGIALLAEPLARCVREGLPAFLETHKEANLTYHRRFGFDVTGVIELPCCPPLWTMTWPRQPDRDLRELRQ